MVLGYKGLTHELVIRQKAVVLRRHTTDEFDLNVTVNHLFWNHTQNDIDDVEIADFQGDDADYDARNFCRIHGLTIVEPA